MHVDNVFEDMNDVMTTSGGYFEGGRGGAKSAPGGKNKNVYAYPIVLIDVVLKFQVHPLSGFGTVWMRKKSVTDGQKDRMTE